MTTYQEQVAKYSYWLMRAAKAGVRQDLVNVLCHFRDNCKCHIRREALRNVLNTVGAGSK